MEYINLVRKASGEIISQIDSIPEIAVILGSGLGDFANTLNNKREISYFEISGFPTSTVVGHAGKLVCGEIDGKEVLCMSGRFHYYEGYSMSEIAFVIRVLKVIGIKKIIVTCATGGINKDFVPGDLMIINDHIKFFDESPLRGKHYEEFGPRFDDMGDAYTKSLIKVGKAAAVGENIDIKEGVYAFMPGPSFETPAEIRALSTLGADVVGMSTVPEVITAANCGIQVLGIACVTNMAAGISKTPLTHEEVFETAQGAKEKFIRLINNIIQKI